MISEDNLSEDCNFSKESDVKSDSSQKIKRKTPKTGSDTKKYKKRNSNPDSDFFKFEDKEDSNFNEIEDLVQYKSPKYFQRNYDNLTVYKREHPFNASKNTIETGVIHSSRPILKIYDGDCTQYYPPNKQEHFKEVVITKNKLLKCSLSSLEFEHHNLFSMEHVLQRKLLNSFESYQKRIKDEKMIKLLEEFQENVKSIKDVRKLRKNWMQESKVQRKELKKLLDTWKVLKELRITQKYSSTQVKVIVPQENLDIIKEMDIFEEILVKLIKTRTKEENDTISERAKNELEKYLKNLKPKLRCHLAKTNETTTDVEDELEIERRKEVFSTKIYMKIFCDGIQVCRTKPVRLTDDFILDINELFLIQLTTDPEYLNLEIYEETNRSSKKKICNIELKIPQSEVFYDETEEKEVFFSENTLKIHKHSAVGSGISLNEFFKKMNFDLIETRSNKLYTTGKVVFRLGWQNLQIEKKDLPNRSRFDIENKWGTVDKDLLHRLLNNNEEMNLEDAWIVDYLNLETDDDDYFRINKSSFSGEDVIENNLRFQCLKLRDQHEIEFDGSEISNKVRQIPVAQLKNFKIRKSVKTETEDVDEFIQTGKRRLMQLYTNIFLICKGLRYNMSYQSVVDERWLSYFGQVLKISVRNFINQFRWRPKLYKPLPNLVKSPFHAQSTIETSHQKQHKIQIKIMNGKNIPERKLEENKLGVNAFLEVSYDGVFSQTSVQSGPNPIWNELVELPVKVSEYLNKPITLDLFDRIQDSDNTRNYWIGEIKIPLPALCTGFNMCGLFKVRKPEVSFRHLLQDTSNSKFLRHNELTDTYIYLELRLISNIPSLEPNMGELPTNEIPQVKVHILNWEKEYSTSFPNKNVYGLVIDSIGKTNCVTRYLRPLEPLRLDDEDSNVTMEQCLKYVSLIPFIDCGQFYKKIWLRSEELLKHMIGSITDHCVTLVCFLLALKINAYLLMGYGIPHGSTCYVLVVEHSKNGQQTDYFILDVCYNEKFKLTDPLCPLQSIYCIANGDNVWGNVQRFTNPASLRFDVTKRGEWWPLFNDTVPTPKNLLNNPLNFIFIQNRSEKIEKELERMLKRKFCKWRMLETTSFNHRLSDLCKNVLKLFETNSMHGKNNEDALLEIHKTTSKHLEIGIILNTSFESVTSIVKKIKRLNIHEENANEFILSVFVQSYPLHVVSVWIFVAALTET